TDLATLFVVERSRLVEHRSADVQLADVVDECAPVDLGYRFDGEPGGAGDTGGQRRDPPRVLEGPRPHPLHLRAPHARAMFGLAGPGPLLVSHCWCFGRSLSAT